MSALGRAQKRLAAGHQEVLAEVVVESDANTVSLLESGE